MMYNASSASVDQHTMDEFLENIISIPSWPDAAPAPGGSGLRSHWSDYNPGARSSSLSQTSDLLVAPFQNQLGVSQIQNQSPQQIVLPDDHHHSMVLDHNEGPENGLNEIVGAPLKPEDDPSSVKKRYRDEDECGNIQSSGLANSQVYGVEQVTTPSQAPGQTYVSDATPAAVPPTGIMRPRVRARRGHATDPHSIAERLRRERIAERMKALQELVPNANKTDKASMLDEIIDYVKFLQLQVKVLSMSRLGGMGMTTAPLVADLPPEVKTTIELDPVQSILEKFQSFVQGNQSFLTAATLAARNAAVASAQVQSSPQEATALTELQVSRLMEEDMGSAMQYLQSKGLCLMPISLASSISTPGHAGKAIATPQASHQAASVYLFWKK